MSLGRMQGMMRHTAATLILLPPCKTHVGPHARRRKSKRAFSTEKHPRNPSYKVQRLHAAVLLQSGSNCLRSLDADLVVALQKSCWPSRTAMKMQTRIQTSAKFILQGTATARCCSVVERQLSPSLPRPRFGSSSAKLMLALTHADEKANANLAL